VGRSFDNLNQLTVERILAKYTPGTSFVLYFWGTLQNKALHANKNSRVITGFQLPKLDGPKLDSSKLEVKKTRVVRGVVFPFPSSFFAPLIS